MDVLPIGAASIAVKSGKPCFRGRIQPPGRGSRIYNYFLGGNFMARATDYQLGGADSLETNRSEKRPSDQTAPDKNTFQMGGADTIDEMTRKDLDPPYSNPGDKGTFQMGGADSVDERGPNPTWPWANHVGDLTKPKS